MTKMNNKDLQEFEIKLSNYLTSRLSHFIDEEMLNEDDIDDITLAISDLVLDILEGEVDE